MYLSFHLISIRMCNAGEIVMVLDKSNQVCSI